MGFAYAQLTDVQEAYEAPIPAHLQPKVTAYLERASTRLSVVVKKRTKIALRPRWEADEAEGDLRLFVRDMVADAAERKLRNPGGFSHEAAGVFSVSRYDDFSKGRITFDPDDLALLDDMLESSATERAMGPVRSVVPGYRLP